MSSGNSGRDNSPVEAEEVSAAAAAPLEILWEMLRHGAGKAAFI